MPVIIFYKVSFSLFIVIISNMFPMNLCWFVVGKLLVVVDLCLGVETFVCCRWYDHFWALAGVSVH